MLKCFAYYLFRLLDNICRDIIEFIAKTAKVVYYYVTIKIRYCFSVNINLFDVYVNPELK